MQKNKEIYNEVKKVIEKNKKNEKSVSDGLFVLAVYKKGKKQEIVSLVNGMKPIEIEVALREVYSKVYEIRKRNDKKMIKLNKKLKK